MKSIPRFYTILTTVLLFSFADAVRAVPPLEVVTPRGNATILKPQGGLPANFVGYFSPKAGEKFDAKDPQGNWHSYTQAADYGGRFNEPRPNNETHKGIDFLGWVEKVTPPAGKPLGYVIHLFGTNWGVYTVVAGILDSKTADAVYTEHYSPDETSEDYQHITVSLTQTAGQDVPKETHLGNLTDLGVGGTHLHYAVKDGESTYIDPLSEGAGARGFKVTVVPELPTANLALLCFMVLLTRWAGWNHQGSTHH